MRSHLFEKSVLARSVRVLQKGQLNGANYGTLQKPRPRTRVQEVNIHFANSSSSVKHIVHALFSAGMGFGETDRGSHAAFSDSKQGFHMEPTTCS